MSYFFSGRTFAKGSIDMLLLSKSACRGKRIRGLSVGG